MEHLVTPSPYGWRSFLSDELAIFFKTASAELGSSTSRKTRPLEIGIFTNHAGRIEFGRANAVGITARHATPFGADITLFHN